MSLSRTNEPFLKTIKRQILGITYLLLNPSQLKHIIVRETRYRQRCQNSLSWVKWQEYEEYTGQCDQQTALAQLEQNSPTKALEITPLQVTRIETITKMINGLGKSLKVLDVGCGNGLVSEHISNMGNSVTCADLPMMTSLTHKRRTLLVVAALAEQLAFASDSFDVVVAFEMLEHLWHPQSFLDEANRVLKPDGHLIIEVPEGKEGLRWDCHIQYFTEEILQQMTSTKFTVSEVKILEPVKGVPTPTIIMLLRKK